MCYLFDKCGADDTGPVLIPTTYAAALRRQMRTDYADLSDHEKDSDRAEADKMISIIESSS